MGKNKIRPNNQISGNISVASKLPLCISCKYYETSYRKVPCINCYNNVHLRDHYRKTCKNLFTDYRLI